MPQKNDVILSLNQEAQELKKKGVDVTNGAIGMMYLDDGNFRFHKKSDACFLIIPKTKI
jgi:hypothetical protein